MATRPFHWLSRGGESLPPGTRALEAVHDAELPEGPLCAWVGGRRVPAGTDIRRHLLNKRGVPKRDIAFYGYWRVARSTPG
ncbi:SIP domain-containing protein [Streptomyces sp. NPDC055078]